MCYGSILEDAMRKARKRHQCAVCDKSIEAGDRYRYTATVDADGIAQTRSHRRCSAILAASGIVDHDGCVYGHVSDVLRDAARTSGWRELLKEARMIFKLRKERKQ